MEQLFEEKGLGQQISALKGKRKKFKAQMLMHVGKHNLQFFLYRIRN